MSDIKTYKDLYIEIDSKESSKGGGQGTTFQVKHKFSDGDLPYIIKILKQQKDKDRRGRMRREFTSLQTIKVKGIPSAIDSNTEFFSNIDYKLFIIMEAIPGHTLAEYVDLLKSQSISITFLEIVSFFNNFLEIIKECHESNIIHRDLKPDNIILKDNDILDPYLVDFGQSFNEIDHELTLDTPDFQIMGNRFLFLPELAKNSPNKKDYRSDITMAVAVLFYILTGKEVGHLTDEENKLPHQRDIYLSFLCKIDPEISQRLKRVFDKGFQQNINTRYQSIDALKQEFNDAVNVLIMDHNLKNKLNQFNKDRQNESAKALLLLDNKLKRISISLDGLSHNIAVIQFENSLTKIAGKFIKILKESIGGITFTYIDKIDIEKKISLKIIGKIIGNEVIFIGEVIDFALDDNIQVSRGDTIFRINIDDNLDEEMLHVENYIITKTIEYLTKVSH